MRGLIRACHPEPTVAVTAITTLLAASVGRDARGCVLVAVTVLAGQLSVGWSNDWIDARRDHLALRIDKPVVAGELATATVRRAALVAVVLCVPLSFANGAGAGAVHLLAVASAWAYNLGLKSTPFSWLPYAVSFGLLPVFVTLGLPTPVVAPGWAVASGALLGIGAHMANVLPDITGDRQLGVNGLPQRLGAQRTRLLAPVPLALASLTLVFGPPGPPRAIAWVGLIVVAVLLGALLVDRSDATNSRRAFRVAMGIALVDVGLFVVSGTSLV